MTSESADQHWVSGTTASRRLACDPKQVPKLAAKGFLTVRRLPGCDPRYLLADVERLASQSTLAASINPDTAEEFAVSGVSEHQPNETGPIAMDREGGRS